MHIEDKDIRDKNNDGMDCWEFTYQQIESTTMSQYEFDMINTIDEKARKKLKEGDKGDFFPFFYLVQQEAAEEPAPKYRLKFYF